MLHENHVMFSVLDSWLNLWLCDITSPWLHKLLTESLGIFHMPLCWVLLHREGWGGTENLCFVWCVWETSNQKNLKFQMKISDV